MGATESVAGLLGADALLLPRAERLPEDIVVHRPPELRGFASLKFLWEEFIVPLAEHLVPLVHAAVREFAPQVLVVDQQAIAGALVAERLGLPWVTSATTSAELVSPLAGMPKLESWLDELLGGLRARHGDPAATGDLRFSPHLLLAFTTEALVGEIGRPTSFVGPSITARPEGTGFPWDKLDPARKLVLVSLGTANVDVGERFLSAAVEALAELSDRVQGVVVDPGGTVAPAGDVLVLPRVPQLALLAHCSAVVSHGGHNTVCETLTNGVPLVVAPIRDDQPIVAQQVVDAGAGVRLRFGRTTAQQLRAAIESVVDDPAYAEGARRVQSSFATAGGAGAAARCLVDLANRSAATLINGLNR
ncbi:UDP:flavonoid glycosyltransferase YjiC (YdhE family) [Kutzneria viridogrisea]|uniref:UDP:flavonoid glycosyltransferase YjiC (YdhE family) n=1 Tax=Kutzneria viridogrisea TaxID=47990 RepID=A0ABR6BT39_9PSEU|nr:UDP:flavonoid glycosyltransferase YjiC (YdhE family) [Kutzneria viridogrisea]